MRALGSRFDVIVRPRRRCAFEEMQSVARNKAGVIDLDHAEDREDFDDPSIK
jgi:hypothetical protein